MSQITIQILHQDYVLTCPDGQEAQLQEAVERVDQQFQKMRDTSKLRSRERVGVLLAVNLAYENLELRQQLQTLQEQLAQAQGCAAVVLTEADAQRLQALEEQAAHDQALAEQLAQRLDMAIDLGGAADTIAPPLVSAVPEAVVQKPEPSDHTPVTDARTANTSPTTTVLDNNNQVELHHQAFESL